ncbi:MAG: deoxyhypusine synthase family protein [Candidatus Altimarinota bacterium]
MNISQFMDHHFRHFNARETRDAARGWKEHLEKGGKMFLAMGGAMSTAELGLSLAEMIRQDKIHAISCSANNLEEDIYNLVAHDFYRMIPNYRDLTNADEKKLYDESLNRVTDTCIPEEEAFRRIQKALLPLLQEADKNGKRYFPYELFYELIRSKALEPSYQIDPKDSWVVAACEKNIPIFSPGFEDCTFGNIYVSMVMDGLLSGYHVIKSGFEQMALLADWYTETQKEHSIGFFQIAGGIAGDFPICVVPMLIQDMEREVKFWGYFAQIGDSTTSYGSYSGAVPSEKITWGKLDVDTPKFMINSDATIVAPLIFHYVLGQGNKKKL